MEVKNVLRKHKEFGDETVNDLKVMNTSGYRGYPIFQHKQIEILSSPDISVLCFSSYLVSYPLIAAVACVSTLCFMVFNYDVTSLS